VTFTHEEGYRFHGDGYTTHSFASRIQIGVPYYCEVSSPVVYEDPGYATPKFPVLDFHDGSEIVRVPVEKAAEELTLTLGGNNVLVGAASSGRSNKPQKEAHKLRGGI